MTAFEDFVIEEVTLQTPGQPRRFPEKRAILIAGVTPFLGCQRLAGGAVLEECSLGHGQVPLHVGQAVPAGEQDPIVPDRGDLDPRDPPPFELALDQVA